MNIDKLKREFRNGKYEKTEDGGIFMPAAKILFGGVFSNQVLHADGSHTDEEFGPNIVVNEGLDYALGAMFDSGVTTPITTWYLGIFEANYTPVSTDTAANIATNSTESSAYDEATRPAWSFASPVSGQSIDNLSSKATFTMNATKTIYGGFLVSTNVKSGTTGTLIAASQFPTARAVIATDQLLVSYQLTAQDVV